MAEVKHINTSAGKKVEIFVSAEELMKALTYQDPAFQKVTPTYGEYCLTFDEGE